VQPRQSEVEELARAVVAEECVRGFDVAVKNASGVRSGQPSSEVCADGRDALGGQWQVDPVETSSREQLGDEHGAPVVLARPVHPEDVGVREARDRPRLDTGPQAPFLGEQAAELHGDRAVQQRVVCEPYASHAAAAEQALDMELADGGRGRPCVRELRRDEGQPPRLVDACLEDDARALAPEPIRERSGPRRRDDPERDPLLGVEMLRDEGRPEHAAQQRPLDAVASRNDVTRAQRTGCRERRRRLRVPGRGTRELGQRSPARRAFIDMRLDVGARVGGQVPLGKLHEGRLRRTSGRETRRTTGARFHGRPPPRRGRRSVGTSPLGGRLPISPSMAGRAGHLLLSF
jgi:hypothetical protein